MRLYHLRRDGVGVVAEVVMFESGSVAVSFLPANGEPTVAVYDSLADVSASYADGETWLEFGVPLPMGDLERFTDAVWSRNRALPWRIDDQDRLLRAQVQNTVLDTKLMVEGIPVSSWLAAPADSTPPPPAGRGAFLREWIGLASGWGRA